MANREFCRLVVRAALVNFVAIPCSSPAQPIQFGFAAAIPQVELTAAHVDAVAGNTSARLEQAHALVAARNWDEALDIYLELLGDRSGRVVALDNGRYVSLRTYCHLQLSRLPAEGLAAYRRRVDAQAEKWYRAGIANRDEHVLRRVVDELFCSSSGDDALLALGELALERGDYASARGYWEQISPLLRAPNGMPMWLALRGSDLNAKWPEVERWWTSRDKPADWLAYPDTQIDLADVRARLVLASVRAGDLERAALELEVFRRLHPAAAGQLGGQKEMYLAALERLLAAARQWPAEPAKTDWSTFAGSEKRSTVAEPIASLLVPIWKEAIPLSPPAFARGTPAEPGGASGGGLVDDVASAAVRESQRPLSCYPVVSDGVVVFADGAGIRAADLETGKSAITANGVLYRNESSVEKTQPTPFTAAGGVVHGVPRLTLDIADGIVFARVGTLATSHVQASQSSARDRIIGLDLRREGLLTFRSSRVVGAWSFDGTPVSDGRRVYVAMRHSDVTPQAYVACFDATTGVQQWRTSIGSADTPAGGAGDEITHHLLTLVENRIYFNTNLGLVAALDAGTGEICWLSRYDRLTGKSIMVGFAGPLHFDRDPSPCLYHEGLLMVAPSDTPAIFAMDANTGKTIWQNDSFPDALHLLAVRGADLIVSGNRLAALDAASGRSLWVWPESEHAGIRGMGRGVVAGNEVFWPTRDAIYVIDANSGRQTRSPISLAPKSGGANLVVAEGQLVVAGYDRLIVFGPPDDRSVTKSINNISRKDAKSPRKEPGGS